MISGGRKFQKSQKTKFKKNKDFENIKLNKQKHHDKSTYRLKREEEDGYYFGR